VIELILSSLSFTLLRPNTNKYLTGNLKAVWPFKAPKLFFNFDPGSIYHVQARLIGS
jgi:hypothetical protein